MISSDHSYAWTGVRTAASSDNSNATGVRSAASLDHSYATGVRTAASSDNSYATGVRSAASLDHSYATGLRNRYTKDNIANKLPNNDTHELNDGTRYTPDVNEASMNDNDNSTIDQPIQPQYTTSFSDVVRGMHSKAKNSRVRPLQPDVSDNTFANNEHNNTSSNQQLHSQFIGNAVAFIDQTFTPNITQPHSTVQGITQNDHDNAALPPQSTHSAHPITGEESDNIKCRKLGISFESPQENTLPNDNRNRRRRNKTRITKKEKQLGISADDLPNPPPLSDNLQFNTAMDAIRSFELTQMSYKFNFCEICKERRLQQKMKSQTVCVRCSSDKHEIKMFSSENSMDPGDVPSELSDMSIVEQQLICRLSPAIHVHMLVHGGVAANGHCVTFPQHVNEPAKILPKLPSDIDVIRVTRQGKNNKSKDFRCRRFKVQHALEWLKNNNPAYSDIIISQENLSLLPMDEQINLQSLHVNNHNNFNINDEGPAPNQTNVNATIEGISDSGVLLQDPNVNIRQEKVNVIHNVTGEDLGVTINSKKKEAKFPWPTRGETPVSEFTTRIFFTLSFPTLFPNQNGDFYMNRLRTCTSMSDWADHLMWYKDGRYAKHSYFKFIVHNMIMRKRTLEMSSFVVKQKLGESHYSIEEVKEKIRAGDRSLAEKLLYFSAPLRGTSQYWAQCSKELRSLIQYEINSENGLPSFFTTGSCAEYHFKPLRRLLHNYIFLTTGTEPDLQDKNVLFQVLQQHTHIVAQYFDLRTQSYFKEVMGPVFGVNTYWYRQEFAKSRGMIHWHGLCWRSDKQPHVLLHDAVNAGLSSDERANKLSDWASEIFGMTATHPAGKDDSGQSRKEYWPPPEGTAPAPEDEKNPLVKLLMDVSESQESLLEDHLLLTNRMNIHRCSDYCLRLPPNSRANIRKCRMEFGSENNPGKELRDNPSIVLDKNRNERLEMARDHPLLVQHSRYHTQGWRANGDISIILSKNGPQNPSIDEIIATENYITGYACKGNEATGALVDLFNDTISSTDSTENTVKSFIFVGPNFRGFMKIGIFVGT